MFVAKPGKLGDDGLEFWSVRGLEHEPDVDSEHVLVHYLSGVVVVDPDVLLSLGSVRPSNLRILGDKVDHLLVFLSKSGIGTLPAVVQAVKPRKSGMLHTDTLPEPEPDCP